MMGFLERITGRTPGVKQTPETAGAEAAVNVGYRPWGLPVRRGAGGNPRRLETLMGTYGGTDDSVIWVFACTSLIQAEMASYPYEISTSSDRVLPTPSIPDDLRELLDEPNEDMTYFDFVEYKQMDEELSGNSFWLKDQMNPLGQPFALHRLRPEFVQIAVNDTGRVVGYIYHVTGMAIPVPFDREEVIHFKRPNPLSEYYGMGVVEAIQRTLEADLAETDHIVGFYTDGAQLSGVLTTQTLTETQFERFKQQFYEEYTGAENRHKILIAENGTEFEPITESPAGSGVVELKKMTKDEILAGFGVPASLLGGVHETANYKLTDDQHIFSRKMVPRARRTSDKMTRGLVRSWRLQYSINVTFAEPRSVKIDRAANMLKGGATINEARREMDEPPITEEWANTPVIPQGFAPFGFMTSGGAPSRTPVNGGGPVAEGGLVNGNNPAELVGARVRRRRDGKSFAIRYPEGYEQPDTVTVKTADPEVASEWLHHQARVLEEGGIRVDGIVQRFVVEQRARILRRIGQFGDDHNAARFSDRKSRMAKKDLSISTVWDTRLENSSLESAFLAAVDEVAAITMDFDLFDVTWEPDSDMARTVYSDIAKKVTGVNETTRDRVAAIIALGLQRGYSIRQIAMGYPDENYPGVMGVFDEISEGRARVIARTETADVHNHVALRAFEVGKIERCEVVDGTGDEECAKANGAVWTVGRALGDRLGHPNCTRAFVPVD